MLKSTQDTEFVDMFPSGHRAPDILQTLWRWKPLPILGALLGLIGGYFYFHASPPDIYQRHWFKYFTPGPIPPESIRLHLPIRFEANRDSTNR